MAYDFPFEHSSWRSAERGTCSNAPAARAAPSGKETLQETAARRHGMTSLWRNQTSRSAIRAFQFFGFFIGDTFDAQGKLIARASQVEPAGHRLTLFTTFDLSPALPAL